jgi:hypothetical protein
MAPKVQPVPVSKVDHLKEDDPIVGQNYVAVSFVNPEAVIARKDAFATKLFLKSRCDGLDEMLTELASLSEEGKTLAGAFRQRHSEWLDSGVTEAAYDLFLEDNQEMINTRYSEEHGGVCCTRGIKVRGVYDTLDAAKGRCQLLQAEDPTHDVFVMSVGKWCPWNPAARSMDEVKYAESELNGIMEGYKNKADAKAAEFGRETDARVLKAKEEGQMGASSSAAVVEETEAVPQIFDEAGDAHAVAAEASKKPVPATKRAGKKAPAPKKPAAKKAVAVEPAEAAEPAAAEPVAEPESPAEPETPAAKPAPKKRAPKKK